MKIFRLLVFLVLAMIVGCTTSPICVTSSVTPLQGKKIENLGKSVGEDTAYSFLGLFMIGRPELDLAIKNAIEKKGGDTIINVKCYETSNYFLLFSKTTVTIEGDVVRLLPEDGQSKGKGK